MRQLYSDQAEARQTFLRAKAIYEDLMGAAPTDKELRDRIRYGYGQTCEALSVVDVPEMHKKYLAQAQESYRDLAQNTKSTGIKRLAEYRLRILSPITGKTWEEGKILAEREDWASWLAQQELPEELLPPAGDGTSQFPPLPNGATFDPSALPPALQSGGDEPPALPEGKAPEPAPGTDKDDAQPADAKDPKPEKGDAPTPPKENDAKPEEPPKK